MDTGANGWYCWAFGKGGAGCKLSITRMAGPDIELLVHI